jgi:hypothetical protein
MPGMSTTERTTAAVSVGLAIAGAMAVIAYNNPLTYKSRVLPAMLGIVVIGIIAILAYEFAMLRAKSAMRNMPDPADAVEAMEIIEKAQGPSTKLFFGLLAVAFYAALLSAFNKAMP